MKVRMLHGLSGGIQAIPGDVLDFADDEAVRLINAGFALPHGKPTIETPEKPRVSEKRSPAKKAKKKSAK